VTATVVPGANVELSAGLVMRTVGGCPAGGGVGAGVGVGVGGAATVTVMTRWPSAPSLSMACAWMMCVPAGTPSHTAS
jgi:hypothetical protein